MPTRNPSVRSTGANRNAFATIRPAVLGLSKALFVGLSSAAALPIHARDKLHDGDESEGSALWILYVVSMALVLLGGAFAGLTIALMGQDSINMQVLSEDPTEPQRKNAKRVLTLLKKGKHWVLVTLLLSNVIVNETLPVVLDRCFGGGVAAVVGSTVLIVIFGEIIPQSLCVRYGLQIGGYMSKPVLLLMWATAPVAWPIAKLLDWLLGEDEGTVYKKSGLKTLVTLHKSLGEVSERLNHDEVTIISAVLDLKQKPVRNVMTPMEDVFTMSENTILDEKMMMQILSAGYSRIPIHQDGNPTNFLGMLLVKMLITYDPEDCQPVSDFALATLPETLPVTSCLDILNFFQEGKSHMVLVSENPGGLDGAVGVITLEDVIEELIGEEIIDELDVFVDIHKQIRRANLAPQAKIARKALEANKDEDLIDLDGGKNGQALHPRASSLSGNTENTSAISNSPKLTTFMIRRKSTGQDGQMAGTSTVPVKSNVDDMRSHLKHLGPSNPASNPRSTRVSAVKIKAAAPAKTQHRNSSVANEVIHETAGDVDGADDVDERTSLLRPQVSGKDGVQALHQNQDYSGTASGDQASKPFDNPTLVVSPKVDIPEQLTRSTQTKTDDLAEEQNKAPSHRSSLDSVRSLRSQHSNVYLPKRSTVRSGSITENVVEADGIRKIVLEATSSSDEHAEGLGSATLTQSKASLLSPGPASDDEDDHDKDGAEPSTSSNTGSSNQQGGGKKKNRRKKRKGGGK